MPMLSNFAAGAARGFGLGTKKGGGVLNTVVLPAGSSNWVCPAGVTVLSSMVGKGADATSDVWLADRLLAQFIALATGSSSNANAPYASWATLKATFDSVHALYQGSTAVRFVSFSNKPYYYVGPDNTYITLMSSDSDTVRGAVTMRGVSGNSDFNTPTTGDITYAYLQPLAGGWAGWEVRGERRSSQGAAGASTTGIGQTFPGGYYDSGTGTGSAATNTTFTNVAVTPGTSYPIVNNGSLTIQYYT